MNAQHHIPSLDRSRWAPTNLSWQPFPAPLSFPALPAGQEWNLRLGVRGTMLASAAPGSTFQSLLEVIDDLGMKWVIPVSASSADATADSQPAFGPGAAEFAGLWIGDAVLNAVSQPAHLGNPSATRTAGGNFSFRIIVHVDATGTARLLQQIFLVRKPPVPEPDAEDPFVNRVVASSCWRTTRCGPIIVMTTPASG